MNQILTKGIVLRRTDYSEADRIITLLTPDHGKLTLMARGVRRAKSKLAGGIELFSVSDLTFIKGKGDIGTLISARLDQYYDKIVTDINRVQTGYELIKILNKATEDQTESEYFDLLQQAFADLNDSAISLELIHLWFQAQLLKLAGHTPNLQTDITGQKLQADQTYNFDFDAMTFAPHPSGHFQADQIKALRLLFDGHPPAKLQQVQGMGGLLPALAPLLRTAATTFIRSE
jgi:DNA repair protein RecO (recombination protein O)